MVLSRLEGGRRDNARGGAALAFAREAAQWLDKFHPTKADTPAELDDVLDICMNVADQFKQARRFDDALGLVRLGSDLARGAGNRDFLAMFLWVSAEVSQQRGDLYSALAAIQESVQVQESVPGDADVRHTMRMAHVLIWSGRILGHDSGISLGRSQEALAPLDRAFRISDEVVHQEEKDWNVRGRLAMAGLAMADILRHSDAKRTWSRPARPLRNA